MAERPHYRLVVWQKSLDLIEQIYQLAKQFPPDEKYGLASQMKRASVSIASNIAEGAARTSNGEKLHFFYIARGSLSELETQLCICVRLGFSSPNAYQDTQATAEYVGVLLNGLIESRQKRLHASAQLR